MTPKTQTLVRHWIRGIMLGVVPCLAIGVIIVLGMGIWDPAAEQKRAQNEKQTAGMSLLSKHSDSEEISSDLEWVRIKSNNVLFWPVRGGRCVRKLPMMQVHQDEKALIIQRHENQMVEVELNDQTRPFTHGCVHETMLKDE